MGLLDRMPEADRQQLKALVKRVGLVVGITVAVLYAFHFWSERKQAAARAALQPWAEMARASVQGQPPPKEALDPDGGYVKGRVLPVEHKHGAPDQIHFELPPPLRSAKPEDVGTIVWLEYGQKLVGKYEGGAWAYAQTCRITLIDRARNVIIARQNVEGPPPPQTISEREHAGYGGMPWPQVIAYLSSLPKR